MSGGCSGHPLDYAWSNFCSCQLFDRVVEAVHVKALFHIVSQKQHIAVFSRLDP